MEHQFTVPAIKRAYSDDFTRFGRPGVVGYWFEMDHPYEGHRNFADTNDIYLNTYNWRRILRPNTTVIDIGGHSGDTAVPMGAMTGGTVLTVECNPVVRPWLEFACQMNRHLAKYIVAHEAVTTEDNVMVTFSDHGNQMCNGGLVDHSWGIGAGNNSIQVPGVTLETLCRRYLTSEEINRIDLIKIDTEGHDCLILDSSREFIDSLRPTIIIEWFSSFDNAQAEAMFEIIASLDYVALYPKNFKFADATEPSEDLLLIHRSKLDDFLK